MKVFIGADHRGFPLKELLKPWIASFEHEVVDCGNTILDKEDDFTDFAFAVADHVTKEKGSFGIFICGSGVGGMISGNKVKGIFCGIGMNSDCVRHSRKHDDINMLTLGSDYTNENEAKTMIEIFFETPFDSQDRFTRRIRKIQARET